MADLPGTPFDVGDLLPCALCKKGMMHGRNIIFYELQIAQCVIDARNVKSMHGLELMMGGAIGIARALSPSNAVARRLPSERKLICQPCLLENTTLAILMENSDG